MDWIKFHSIIIIYVSDFPAQLETQKSIRKSLGVNVWIKDRLVLVCKISDIISSPLVSEKRELRKYTIKLIWESITTQKSPKDLRQSFRKLQKRRSTFITVEGVEYRICMERVAKERCDSKRSDYVLASIEALKGSSAEVTSLSDHEDASTYALSQAAGRLRGIIALVNSGYLTMEILLQNLEAAARLLEGEVTCC